MKKSSTTPNLDSLRRGLTAGPEEDQDDEDEETLKLQLQALEAKLKLKRLQQRKNKPETPVSNTGRSIAIESERKENVPPVSRKDIHVDILQNVQIPVSPQRKALPVAESRSPGRILLGIDKGLKGKNVSLRRPTKIDPQIDDPFLSSVPPSSIVRRDSSRRTDDTQHVRSSKSFSERIAESRHLENARIERETKRHRQRSNGFGIDQKQVEDLAHHVEKDSGCRARAKEGVSAQRDGFSREQVLSAINKRDPGVIRRSKSSASARQELRDLSTDVWINPNAEPELSQSKQSGIKTPSQPRARSHSPPTRSTQEDKELMKSSDHLFEPYSMTHLSKRLLPHDILTRTFNDKSILRIPDLLAKVKSPEYSLPDDLEADYVVLGIIASKSSPLSHKDSTKTTSTNDTTSLDEATTSAQNTRGKFMILTLTDLKWTLDLYLFTTAYTRFYKLTPGTVIALLNPNIMPPQPYKADTGRFSLTLNSSDDTVLEIGASRDLGWCKASRKDGKPCSDWVDKRHTEFCEFHVDRVVERARQGRMEVQGMSAPFAPGGRKQGRTGYFGGGSKGSGPKSRRFEKLESSNDGFRREGQQYDRTTSSTYFVAPRLPGRSAAQLLDAENMMASRGESKEERVRKRLAEREKENEIAKKLGEGGNGAGSEYLRLRQQSSDEISRSGAGYQGENEDMETVDAASLGLKSNRAGQVHLSPLKGIKRKGGWIGDVSARKKTRFVTEKGIREAGRESLPGPGFAPPDEDEDDLEIE